jgi:hypothetical protein
MWILDAERDCFCEFRPDKAVVPMVEPARNFGSAAGGVVDSNEGMIAVRSELEADTEEACRLIRDRLMSRAHRQVELDRPFQSGGAVDAGRSYAAENSG